MKQYRIGNLTIRWLEEQLNILEDSSMEAFADSVESDENVITYKATLSDFAFLKNLKPIQKSGLNEWYETENGRFLLYHWAKCRFAYGFYVKDVKENVEIPVYYSKEMAEGLPINAIRFFSTLGMHEKFLSVESSILHAAHVVWKGSSVLFTAASQTGKSTQAKLWEAHKQAEIVNEDRVLLSRVGEQWYSHGYPCCGSSKISKNKSVPIRCIVLLQQGDRNEIKEMSKSEKIRTFLAGSEVYGGDVWEMDQVIKIAESIIETVPMFRLICTPEKEAVTILEEYLEGR